jgi:hypothetical protein
MTLVGTMGCSVDAASARDLMTGIRKQNEVAMREHFLQARKSGELSKNVNVDDNTRYLSSILAGLSIQAANGSTKAELKRTAQLALRHLGYSGLLQPASAAARPSSKARAGRCCNAEFPAFGDSAPPLDIDASIHQNANMRTTVDFPEDLYRTLKARAGLSGVSLSDLVRRLVEQGLRSSSGEAAAGKRFGPPPVIIPARGKPIPAVMRSELERMEEDEDESKHARLA